MRGFFLCLLSIVSLFCRGALADGIADTLSVSGIDVRLDTATTLLDHQQTNADYWEFGWGAFDTGTLVYSAANADREADRKARNTDIVNAGESLIGLADVVFRPLPAFHADEACAPYPQTEDARRDCLAAKERLLVESAERAQEPYEWLPHLGNAGFNLVAGLLVWRLGGTGRALTTAIPGEIIGEAQLWSIPSGPIADFDQYKIRFSPLLMQTGRANSPAGGVAISWRF